MRVYAVRRRAERVRVSTGPGGVNAEQEDQAAC